ncbi:S26 family signal peptidase [Methanocella sp. MCL-LM]|uniref:S26 family signal peptidase n=1 Tax=Methanocella sp. MCL-LM TaxID=3412035 RepID=UPI003C732184
MEPRGSGGQDSGFLTKRFWIEVAKDIAFIAGFMLVIVGLLYAYSGIWPPMVAVDGHSMLPNLKPDDLILMQSLDRTSVTTYDEAVKQDYRTFNDFGDVIVFRPMGDSQVTPVIHRAMYYVEEGEPMWSGGPPAPHSGYITQGDNNYLYDQSSPISQNQPVKREWVLGVSEFRIPYLGKLRTILGI